MKPGSYDTARDGYWDTFGRVFERGEIVVTRTEAEKGAKTGWTIVREHENGLVVVSREIG